MKIHNITQIQNNNPNFVGKRVTDKMAQNAMIKEFEQNYGDDRIILDGPYGSVVAFPNENTPTPDVKITGKADPNRWVNVWNVERDYGIDENGNPIKKKYFMAARGDVTNPQKKATGVGIVVDYTDKFGKQ